MPDRSPPISDAAIEAALLDALARRGPDKSICPSEPARALSEDWRPLMPRVRAVAARLAARGLLHAARRGVEVDPEAPGGPIRLRAGPGQSVGAAGGSGKS